MAALPISLNVRQNLSITEVTRDGFLYAQLDTPETRNLEKLSQDIYEVVMATPGNSRGFKPSLDSTCKCLAQSNLDNMWYRALVVGHDANTNTYTVHYVDYGNMESGIKADALFPPVTNIFNLPFQAIKCRLAHFTPTSGIDYVQGLRDNVLNQSIPGIFLSKMATHYMVTLFWDDSDDNYTVQEELAAMGLGTYQPYDPAQQVAAPTGALSQVPNDPFQYIDLAVGSRYRIYISYAETPDVVWCQLSQNTDPFESLVISLQEYLLRSPSQPVISDRSKNPPPLNEPCCVLYSADQTWCRGLVVGMDIPSNTADVLFVDFGNTESIPIQEVLALPAQFLKVQAQAVSFSTYGIVPSGKQWSRNALDRFKELYIDQELECSVVCMDNNGYPCVRLTNLKLGCDLAETLVNEGYAVRNVPKDAMSNSTSANTIPAVDSNINSEYSNIKPVDSNIKPVDSSIRSVDSSIRSVDSNIKPFDSNIKPVDSSITPVDSNTTPATKQIKSKVTLNDSDTKPVVTTTEAENNKPPSSKPPRKLSYKTTPLPIDIPFSASVTHINSLKSFYIQLCNQSELITLLADQIDAHIESPNTKPVEVVKSGMPVLAQFSEDHQWYRARMMPPSDVLNDWGVIFVDFGNWQKTQIGKLKAMPEQLMEYPVLSFCCSLHDCLLLDAKNETAVERFNEMTLDQTVECTVLKKLTDKDGRDVHMVKIFKDGVNIFDHLVKVEDVQTNADHQTQAPPFTPLTVPKDERVSVYITHIESTQKFACQPIDNMEAIGILQEKLNIEYSSDEGAPLVKPIAGASCVGLYSGDNQWYRAVIQKVQDSNEVEVLFVDYGNTEVLPLSQVRSIKPDQVSLPCQSIICCLDGLPPKIAEKSTDLFIETCLDKTMDALFFDIKLGVGQPLPCKLFMPDTDNLVSKELQVKIEPPKQIVTNTPNWSDDNNLLAPPTSRSGSRSRQSSDTSLIQSLTVMVPTQFTGMVSFIEDPSEIYIQQNTSVGKLETLLEDMYKYYGTQKKGFPLQAPYIGIHCTAPYNDGNYYRGRVCSIEKDKCQVFYIDYGNMESVVIKDLYTLSSRFTSLPAQALKCSLSCAVTMTTGATPLTGWSQECIQILKDSILNQEVVVDILSLLTEDSYEVKVHVPEGGDIGQMLLHTGLLMPQAQSGTTVSTQSSSISSTPPPGASVISPLSIPVGTTVHAVVTFITTRLYLYCQLSSQTDAVQMITDTISKYMDTSPKPIEPAKVKKGMHVLAQFTEDDAWYRGKVLSMDKGVKIGYIDFGNLEVLPFSRICEIPGVLYDFPCQAIRCQINGLQDCQPLSNEAKATIEETLLLRECSVKLIKKESGQKYIVEMNMADSGESVKDWLLKSKLVSMATSTNNASVTVTKPLIVEPPSVTPSTVTILSSIEPYKGQTVFTGYLSHVESVHSFYCQPLDTSEQLLLLSTDIQSHYEDQVKPKNALPLVVSKGDFVAALYSVDNSWSRAQVVEVKGSGHVEVLFCDYGNKEEVTLGNIRQLESQFTSLPCQAVQCSLKGLQPFKEWQQKDIDAFTELTQESALEMKVGKNGIKNGNGPLEIVSMKTENGLDVGEELVKRGLVSKSEFKPPGSKTSPVHNPKPPSSSLSPAHNPKPPSSSLSPAHNPKPPSSSLSPSERSPSKKRWNSGSSNSSTSSSQSPSSHSTKLLPFNITEGDTLSVYVTHTEDSIVWVQPAAQEPELQALAESLAEVYTPTSVDRLLLNNIKQGRLCCAQFSSDNLWYRARITGIHDNSSVVVRFVDYGNTDIVQNGRLCLLLKEFFTLHQLAIPCVFDTHTSLPTAETEEPINVRFIKRIPKSNKWQVEVLTTTTCPAPSPYPRPHSPYVSIPPLSINQGEQHEVYIVHTESPSCFWCQLVSFSPALEDLMAMIADYYTDKAPGMLHVEQDSYCMAQYSDNDTWYRGRIVEVLEGGEQVHVMFVDYGNEEVMAVDRVAELDPRFASLPCQAFKCSLFDIVSNSFNEKHLESFYSLDFSDSFDLTLTKLLPQEAWFVQLTQSDGQNVNEIFNNTVTPPNDSTEATPTYPTPQFEAQSDIDIYMTSVSGPESFYCQPLMMASELEELMNGIYEYMSQSTKKKGIPIDTINIGQSCLALFGSEEDWFRAQVEDIDLDKNTVLVYYIDYGNMSYVNPDQLAPLPRQFLSVPTQVLHCTALASSEPPLEADKVELFNQLVQEECQYSLTITSYSQPDQKYTVQIHSNLFNKSYDSYLQAQLLNSVGVALNITSPQPTTTSSVDELSKELQENSTEDLKGSKTPTTDIDEEEGISDSGSTATGEPLIVAPCMLSLASGEVVNVTVVHVQDPSQLFIQRLDCAAEFQSLSQEIAQYCSDFADTLVQETYRSGDFVLAFYEVDGLWYRGHVKEVLADHYLSVQFIDYGNLEKVPSNKVIMCPGNFLELPIQAIPCSLSQVPSRDSWPDHYKTLIENAILYTEQKLTVIVPGGQGMYPSVELCNLDGTNDVSQMVLDHLQEECETGPEKEEEQQLEIPVAEDDGESAVDGVSIVEKEETIEEEPPNQQSDNGDVNWTKVNGMEDLSTIENNKNVATSAESLTDTQDIGKESLTEETESKTIDTDTGDVSNDDIDADVNTEGDTNTENVNISDINTDDVNTNTVNVDTNAKDVDTNVENVDSNTENTNISDTNAEDVNTNVEDVNTNTEDVNTNTEDVDTSDTKADDTDTLDVNIEVNTGNTATDINTEDVNTNTDVDTNAKDVNANTEDVDTNAKDVDTNADVNTNVEANTEDVVNTSGNAKADVDTVTPVVDCNAVLIDHYYPEDLSPVPLTRVLKVGTKCNAYLININSPYNFICHLFEHSNVLKSITSMLEGFYTSENGAEYQFKVPPVKGDYVCAKYSKDDQYYRAKILEYCEEAEEYSVEFIDYGNKERVRLSDLKVLDRHLVGVTPLALHCGLYGLPDTVYPEHFTSTLNNEILKCLEEEGEKLLSIEVRTVDVRGDKSFYNVELSTPCVCINDIILVAMARYLEEHSTDNQSEPKEATPVKATPIETPLVEAPLTYATCYPDPSLESYDSFDVTIVSCVSLSEIACVIVDCDKITKIEEAFATLPDQCVPLVHTASIGLPVMVRSSDDKLRRAIILQHTPEQVLVKHVDTGIEDHYPLSVVKQLPQQMADISYPLAFICQLSHLLETDLVPDHGFQSEAWELEWPEHALGYFKDIVKEQGLFTAKVVSLGKEGENMTVELSYYQRKERLDSLKVNVKEFIVTKLREVKPVILDDSINEPSSEDELMVKDAEP